MAGKKQHNWVYAEVTLLQKHQIDFLAAIATKQEGKYVSRANWIEDAISRGIETWRSELSDEDRQRFDALT